MKVQTTPLFKVALGHGKIKNKTMEQNHDRIPIWKDCNQLTDSKYKWT